MKFYFIPYHIVKDKIQSIIEANKDDFLEYYGDVDVDYEYFETLSALGLAYVALMVDNDVAGFAGFAVNHNTTHKETEAENVVFWIGKKHRGTYFPKLIDFSKKEFQKMGVPKITVTVKTGALSKMLKQLDFKKEYEILEVDCG